MMPAKQVVYVVAGGAPPVFDLSRLLVLLRKRGWSSYVVLTPTAATWVDQDVFVRHSGHPVRVEARTPGDPDPLPPADLVIAAPLTFNSLNKWASGVNDTLALGLLNEALGAGTAVVAAPCVKRELRRHPAYERSVAALRSHGVTVLAPDQVLVSGSTGQPTFVWSRLLPSSST